MDKRLYKITANPKKSSALILPPKVNNPIPTIKILFNNNPVSVTKSVKYLGITIDEKLNFAEHITKLTCKIQGVHKVRVHCKKCITLFLFVIEIICKDA